MNTLNEDTTRVLVPKLCACCGFRYSHRGCATGECAVGPRLMSEQFHPERYLAEQAARLDVVTPFSGQPVSEAPRSAVEVARGLIIGKGTIDLHDLEDGMLDLGFVESETHDAVSHLVLIGFCNIDDASALSVVAKPERVIEIPRTFFQRLAALFTGRP